MASVCEKAKSNLLSLQTTDLHCPSFNLVTSLAPRPDYRVLNAVTVHRPAPP